MTDYPDREIVVDLHPTYQAVYKDDGIDEGLKRPIGAIQKASAGKWSMWNPAYWGSNTLGFEKLKAQRESINALETQDMYHWCTNDAVSLQVDAVEYSLDAGDYQMVFLDYEQNISKATALIALAIASELKKRRPGIMVGLYSSNWIYKLLVSWFGLPVLNALVVWGAGGKLYNQVLSEQPEDDYHIWTIPGLIVELEQFAADRDDAAWRLDFGDDKKADIDVSLVNVSRETWLAWHGYSDDPEPEPPDPTEPGECDCAEKLAAAVAEMDEFVLDVLAKVRKTALAMGEDTAKIIEQEYEDLKNNIPALE